MEYSGSQTRMQRRDLPGSPVECSIDRPCVYRVRRLCDEPRINKGNSDAACHRMSNRAVLAALCVPKRDTVRDGQDGAAS
jgi:hypothetical protein